MDLKYLKDILLDDQLFYPICSIKENIKENKKIQPLRFLSKTVFIMVAGIGLEPMTFGL